MQAGASAIWERGSSANLARGGRAVDTVPETPATRIIQLMVDARGNVHQLDAELRLFGLPSTPGNPRLGRRHCVSAGATPRLETHRDARHQDPQASTKRTLKCSYLLPDGKALMKRSTFGCTTFVCVKIIKALQFWTRQPENPLAGKENAQAHSAKENESPSLAVLAWPCWPVHIFPVKRVRGFGQG